MRADRLLSMMILLQARGRMTAADLAGELEVSERTIYRDIDALSFAGIPIYTQSGINGGIFLDEAYRVSLATLNREDIRALFVENSQTPLDDLGLNSRHALLKLLSMLPGVQRSEADVVRQRFYIDPTGWFSDGDPPPCLSILQEAVWQGRRLKLAYRRSDGTLADYHVDAYGLVAKHNVWYLAGRKADGAYRTFRSSRVMQAELQDNFERDPVFDLITYWQQSTHQFQHKFDEMLVPLTALIRVHRSHMWMFSDMMHDAFEPIEADDAWITIRTRYGSMMSATISMLTMGGHAEVLEPDALREAVMQAARDILAVYQE